VPGLAAACERHPVGAKGGVVIDHHRRCVEAVGGNLILLASDDGPSNEELRVRIADRVGGRVSVPAFHLFGEDLLENCG